MKDKENKWTVDRLVESITAPGPLDLPDSVMCSPAARAMAKGALVLASYLDPHPSENPTELPAGLSKAEKYFLVGCRLFAADVAAQLIEGKPPSQPPSLPGERSS